MFVLQTTVMVVRRIFAKGGQKDFSVRG